MDEHGSSQLIDNQAGLQTVLENKNLNFCSQGLTIGFDKKDGMARHVILDFRYQMFVS